MRRAFPFRPTKTHRRRPGGPRGPRGGRRCEPFLRWVGCWVGLFVCWIACVCVCVVIEARRRRRPKWRFSKPASGVPSDDFGPPMARCPPGPRPPLRRVRWTSLERRTACPDPGAELTRDGSGADRERAKPKLSAAAVPVGVAAPSAAPISPGAFPSWRLKSRSPRSSHPPPPQHPLTVPRKPPQQQTKQTQLGGCGLSKPRARWP